MIKLKIAGTCALGVIVPSLLAHTAIAMSWESKILGEDVKAGNEQIYAATSNSTAIAFICHGGELVSAITTTSNDASNVTETYSETKRRLTKKVTLFLDDEAVNTTKWLINPGRQIFVPSERSVTAKLYNAAVRGENVSIQRKGKDKLNLRLPAPNAAFIEFGSECGIGSNKTDMSTK